MLLGQYFNWTDLGKGGGSQTHKCMDGLFAIELI